MDLILWRNAEADEGRDDLERRLTAGTLGIPVKSESALAPGALPARILEAARWPNGKSTVVVVGHQPDLGAVLAEIFSGTSGRWTIKKGGLWWVTNRVRGAEQQIVVRAVVSPDLV